MAHWNSKLAVALLIAAAALTGCTAVRTDTERVEAPPEIIKSSARFKKEYLLFAGDQLEIAVTRFPEVSRTVMVRPDGQISLPLVQDVPAAGFTARELAAELQARLSKRLLNPEVYVIPTQVRQPTVHVFGDVKNPSPVPYRNALTLTQAIGAAGGFLRSGGETDVTIIRLSADGYLEARVVEVTADGQPGAFMHLGVTKLEPDDVIFVPESGRAQVIRFIDEVIFRPLQLFLTYKLIQDI
jgi:polysaccharide export outer membrane protein